MNKIFKMAAIALLAYSCGGEMQKKGQIEQTGKEVPESVVSLDSITSKPADESQKYFFKSDQEIFDSTKAYVERHSDRIWNDVSKLFPIDAKKPYIGVENADPFNYHADMAYWKNDTVGVLVGKEDSTFMLSKLYAKLGQDYDFLEDKLEEYMSHEFGHHLFNTRAKYNGMSDIWGADKNLRGEEKLAFQLISEGIAVYFSYASLKLEPQLIDLEKYQKDESLYSKMLDSYSAGYALVKPIIDKHGLKGIDYLARHPIKKNELDFITLYQKMCLYDLDLEEKMSKMNKGIEDKTEK